MLYRLLVALLQPMPALFFGSAVGAVWMGWKHRDRRRFLAWLSIPWIGLYLYCTPVAAYLAGGTLEWQNPPRKTPASGEPIVVLGAGVRPPDAIRRRAVLRPASIYRCLHGAELYHEAPTSLVIVCGGKPNPKVPGPPSADVMCQLLIDLGVDREHIVVQRESRTTYEDALYTAKILGQRDIQSAILVTDAIHMPRSLHCFRAQGIRVTPSGCRYRATTLLPTIAFFLPHADAVEVNEEVVHEWLGLLWYWIKGRL